MFKEGDIIEHVTSGERAVVILAEEGYLGSTLSRDLPDTYRLSFGSSRPLIKRKEAELTFKINLIPLKMTKEEKLTINL